MGQPGSVQIGDDVLPGTRSLRTVGAERIARRAAGTHWQSDDTARSDHRGGPAPLKQTVELQTYPNRNRAGKLAATDSWMIQLASFSRVSLVESESPGTSQPAVKRSAVTAPGPIQVRPIASRPPMIRQ
eukprot:14301-Hanusia_phi.AAC.1